MNEPTRPTIDTLLHGLHVETDQGDIAFCGVNLIEVPDESGGLTRIVVDTGHFGRGVALRRELAARGLTASDVDVLLLTHAHWDHVQCIQYFDRAVIYAHPEELNYISNPHPGDHATPAWTKAMLDRYDIRHVREGDELAPGVGVVEVPGHSAGTVAAAVSTADGLAVVTGDSIQNALVAQQRRNALVFWDEEIANRSVGRLVDMSDAIYPGHDQPFRITADNQVEYLADFSVGFTGTTRDNPGLSFTDLSLDPFISPAPLEWRNR